MEQSNRKPLNKLISTRSGLITALSITLYILLLQYIHIRQNSPLVLVQFGLLFVGIFVSVFFLYKYYTAIRWVEAFSHALKTLSTVIIIITVANAFMYYLSADTFHFQELTFVLMKTIFAYGISGLLSAFFCSYIFHTFTGKK